MTDDQREYYVEWARQLLVRFPMPFHTLITNRAALEAALGMGELDDALDDALDDVEKALDRLEGVAVCALAETTLR